MTAPGYRMKPCPFCDGEAALEEAERDDNDRAPRPHRVYIISCGACEASIEQMSPAWWSGSHPPSATSEDRATETAVIEKWNRRAAAPQPEPPERDVVAEIKELLDAAGFDLFGGDLKYTWALRRKDSKPIVQPEPPADLVESAKAWIEDPNNPRTETYPEDALAAFAQEHAVAEKARADKTEKALADEREACAIAAAVHSNYPVETEYDRGYADGRREAAAAIRAHKGGGDE